MFNFCIVSRKKYLELLDDLRQTKEANLRITEDKCFTDNNILTMRSECERKGKEAVLARKQAEEYRMKLLNEMGDTQKANELISDYQKLLTSYGINLSERDHGGFGIAMRFQYHGVGDSIYLVEGVNYKLLIQNKTPGDGGISQYWEDCRAVSDEGNGLILQSWDESEETYGEGDEFWFAPEPDAEDIVVPEKIPGFQKFRAWMESVRKEAENEKAE